MPVGSKEVGERPLRSREAAETRWDRWLRLVLVAELEDREVALSPRSRRLTAAASLCGLRREQVAGEAEHQLARPPVGEIEEGVEVPLQPRAPGRNP